MVRRRPASATTAIVRVCAVACLLATSAACDARPRTLVVYVSPSVPDAEARAVERTFEDAHADIAVDVRRLADDDALARLRGRADAPEVGVWWGPPAETYAAAATEGLLVDGAWRVLRVEPFVFAYDPRRVPHTRAPRDWLDLLHVRWTGELLLLDPEVAPSTRTLLGGLALRERRRTGDERDAFDLLARLDRATRAYEPSVDELVRRLSLEEGSLALLPRGAVERARAEGTDWLEHRLPESGAPAATVGAGVVAGAPDPDAARAFLAALPEHAPIAAPDAWPVEPDSLAARLEGWMMRWRTDVRGRHQVPLAARGSG